MLTLSLEFLEEASGEIDGVLETLKFCQYQVNQTCVPAFDYVVYRGKKLKNTPRRLDAMMRRAMDRTKAIAHIKSETKFDLLELHKKM